MKTIIAAIEKALNWCAGKGEYSNGRDTISELAEDVAPALAEALAEAVQLAAAFERMESELAEAQRRLAAKDAKLATLREALALAEKE